MRKKHTFVRKVKMSGQGNILIYNNEARTKIAIVQTGSWGDNINSTLMLKPIISKYPNCILDVYTSTCYGNAFYNNPYITNLMEFAATSKNDAIHLTLTIKDRIQNSGYDLIFAPHPMYNPGNWSSSEHPEFGENIILAWVRALENASIKYNLPLETILVLTNDEKEAARSIFNKCPKNCRNILMEVHGESGQSFWDHNWTIPVAKHLLDGNTNLFISRKNNSSDITELKQFDNEHVHFVGGLSIRECAELFNCCDIFFSTSSGLSNACNTNWCKKDIRWIETINSNVVSSAPIRSQGKIFWYENNINNFIDMLRLNEI